MVSTIISDKDNGVGKKVNWPGTIKYLNNFIYFTATYINENGVIATTDTNINKGQEILVLVRGFHNSQKLSIYAKAQVIRSMLTSAGFELVIHFADLPSKMQEALDDFLNDI
ncbi:hypothetical protein [Spartinivicinus poritis]|uniref:Uncharacterized protein n=1 Tax=Spartinivicinus poritis TaxID=2994640 RepID=A0ABT5UHG0_9GAMM|nr:hypothetical protein [Spartinivicinus sp. A2-2]MDE1465645.1 hypothetical protein [Spartinivicinus sp. A2-2]